MKNHKNLITPAGYQALQDEFTTLKKVERPEVTATVAWAASNGDRSENADYQYGKKRLREIDKRLEFLVRQIDSAEVVDPAKINSDQIQFGATVTILTEDEQTKVYAIVGITEVDVAAGKISWKSPLGAALIGHKKGDFVEYHSPKGAISVEIIQICYESIK